MVSNYLMWKSELLDYLEKGMKQGELIKTFEEIRLKLRSALSKVPYYADITYNEGKNSGFGEVVHTYMAIVNWLHSTPRFYSLAETLMLDWWEVLGERRLEANEPYVYRANASMMLAIHYLEFADDRGMSLKWALLTYAEDAMRNWTKGEGRNILILQFSFSNDAFSRLEEIAKKCADIASSTNNVCPERYSEEVVRQFFLEEGSLPLYEFIPQRPFPISKSYFTALMNEFNKIVENTSEKGDVLENIALYLILTLPGCLPRSKMVFPMTSSENDVLVHNLNPTTSLTTEVFQRHFLVECKNFSHKPMNSNDVGYFLHRMRLARSKFGIIFSTNDITGEDGEYAKAHVIRAFQEDGSSCVVITKEDLETIRIGAKTFWWMLFEKLEKIRFGKPRNIK